MAAGAVQARSSLLADLVVRSGLARARSSLLAELVVYGPTDTHRARASTLAELVVYAGAIWGGPRASLLAELVVFTTALPTAQQMTPAWQFSLDGHTFYVLDLGEQGTFLYDTTTQSWCKFQTQGNVGWNLRVGTMWWPSSVPRIVGADTTGPYVWELDPTALFDEGWRDVEHAATAGIMLRSRVYRSMAELRVAASAGELDDTTGAAYIQLTYSDDGGQTYSAPLIVELAVGATADGQQDIRFPSLGAFMAPGRVLQLSDVGGVLRLDGVDVMIDSYDETQETPESEE